MVKADAASTVVIGPADVEFTALPGTRCLLRTGTKRYVIRPAGRALPALCAVFDSVLPKLTCGLPLGSRLSPSEIALVEPYLERFRAMGVLLFPGADAADAIRTSGDVALYTYVARRTADPDAAYLAVKTRWVELSGPEPVVVAWRDVLTAAGVRVRAGAAGTDRSDPDGDRSGPRPREGFAVVVSDDAATLRATNDQYGRRGVRWVPVLFSPGTIRIGPWTAPGESACLACLPAGWSGPDQAAGAGAGRPEVGASPGGGGEGVPARHGATTASWSTTQPAVLAWAGGLLAHMMLRAFVPLGPDHPWGRVTTIDAVGLEQRCARMWRDPYCTVCARRAPAAQPWTEA